MVVPQRGNASNKHQQEAPALADLLTVFAGRLGAQSVWFVPIDPARRTTRSRSTPDPDPHASPLDPPEVDLAVARWLAAPPSDRGIVSIGATRVQCRAVHSESGQLVGALLVHGAGEVASAADLIDLAAALVPAVVDTPPLPSARRALVDWATARPGGRTAFAISIDELSVANEVLGLAAGDVLLDELVDRVASWVGPDGRVTSAGNARYIAIRNDVRDETTALAEADRLRALIADPVDIDGLPVSRSASIGVAVDAEGSANPELLVASAVRCGAAARTAGGNRTELYDEAATTIVLDRLRLGLELYGALLGGQLRIHYQPEFDLRTGEVVAVEALLRWQHPVLGLLNAETFVPDAEQSHTFGAVQRWVIDESCRQLAEWREHGQASDLLLRLNLAGNLAEAPATDTALRTAFGRYAVAPRQLCVELTERRLPEDISKLARRLQTWRDMGVVIALDDFGVGEGTLTHLLALPIDLVKIDQSFVAAMATDQRAAAVVAGVIRLARSLHLDVVAEGIDGPEVSEALVREGCTHGQGNGLGAAMSAAEIGALLRARYQRR